MDIFWSTVYPKEIYADYNMLYKQPQPLLTDLLPERGPEIRTIFLPAPRFTCIRPTRSSSATPSKPTCSSARTVLHLPTRNRSSVSSSFPPCIRRKRVSVDSV